MPTLKLMDPILTIMDKLMIKINLKVSAANAQQMVLCMKLSLRKVRDKDTAEESVLEMVIIWGILNVINVMEKDA